MPRASCYAWEPNSTYIKHPPYFEDLASEPAPIAADPRARVLAVLGDRITTDHISPAGSISRRVRPAGI